MSPATHLGVSAFAVDERGARSVVVQAAPRVRGASVVKPLLFWVSAKVQAPPGEAAEWEELARAAITYSDNDATAALWSKVGESALLARLEERAAVTWQPDGDGEHPSLRLMVTAAELSSAYAAFALDDAVPAQDLRRWMREARTDQTFGLRAVASDVVGVAESAVGVKCGWFGAERAHAVVLAELDDRVLGGAVTTTWDPDGDERRAAALASGDDTALVAVHNALAGQTLRRAMRRALLVAADL